MGGKKGGRGWKRVERVEMMGRVERVGNGGKIRKKCWKIREKKVERQWKDMEKRLEKGLKRLEKGWKELEKGVDLKEQRIVRFRRIQKNLSQKEKKS